MNSFQKEDEYRKRIHKVQDYISRNFNEKINIEDLAAISAFSPFHFMRIFRKITGENPGCFITRIRLEKSCMLLKFSPGLRITDIALSIGFETPSSFTKSFKAAYGVTPLEYRTLKSQVSGNKDTEKSSTGTLNSSRRKADRFIYRYDSLKFNYKRRESMIMKIEEMQPLRVAYMRRIGAYGEGNYELMDRLKKWAFAHDLFTDDVTILGIAHDDPSVTPAEKCRYDCGIIIPAETVLDDEMNEYFLPGGKYAVCEVNHTADDIAKAWTELLSKWLPSSGYRLDEKPVFERYRKLDENTLGAEICIPVKPV